MKCQMLCSFFENNHNLTDIEILVCNRLRTGGACQLALAVESCNNSLKSFSLSTRNQNPHLGGLVDVIAALILHSQLKHLNLERMNIGRNECTALTTLLRITTELSTLSLRKSNIDDEGLETLVNAIKGSNLSELDISDNPTITIRGWMVLSTLLEMPESNSAV